MSHSAKGRRPSHAPSVGPEDLPIENGGNNPLPAVVESASNASRLADIERDRFVLGLKRLLVNDGRRNSDEVCPRRQQTARDAADRSIGPWDPHSQRPPGRVYVQRGQNRHPLTVLK